ncbi:prolyl oligopeptidase family serine peptidase [Gimesia sp.]|uniref:alpha/beta hydrolase family protein n=1 Tax=Gimesia sp. TaxID=2024833 RepID=UPI0032EAA6AD
MNPSISIFRTFFALLFVACFLPVGFAGEASSKTTQNWSGKQDTWHGFKRVHFPTEGRKSYVVIPEKAAPDNPWVWRARFPDFHYEMDVELLKQGFHIAYLDVSDLFGSPQAIEYGNKFYKRLTQQHGLQSKVALEGVSRGGLFIYNWALANPDKVSCIYADTPVCDFKSWPGGKGKSEGSQARWDACLKSYGLTEQEALDWPNNPVDRIATIAEAEIPVLHIISENDQVVPPDENTLLMFSRVPEKYRKNNFQIIFVKEGTEKSKGHHFTHPEPDRVVKFIRQHTLQSGNRDNSSPTNE